MSKIRVGILCGGRSAEHEISLLSAKNILEALDRKKYRTVVIGIGRSGLWSVLKKKNFILDAEGAETVRLNPQGKPAALAPEDSLYVRGEDAWKALETIDVVIPVLHGPFGEDGAVQGLLKCAGIPFAGAGVLGSALGMDKDVMKRLLRDAGIPVARFVALRDSDPLPDFESVTERLGLPLFVKPANMGSSVGVHKIHDRFEYEAMVKDAFRFDRKIVIEEFIEGREIECAVLETGEGGALASPPGEIVPSHEFYSYDAKYIDDNGAALEIPAKIPGETAQALREMAETVFRVLECAGLARVDFFLRNDGGIVVNEINTMPGFTRISMFPKLWEEAGVSPSDLLDRLIGSALARHEKETALQTKPG